ncbi:GtrA family protein, partial [Erwinia billingiae]|uniref:GtrA family protein n=1 Tax=Erwinia billingiae TaxID=182337 RepID=UPI00156ACF94
LTLLKVFNASQSTSNLIAFGCAVTFSFFVNAKWTFKSDATALKYSLYIIFMGGLAWAVGLVADLSDFPAFATLIIFSFISLICGFLYSKYFVFKVRT